MPLPSTILNRFENVINWVTLLIVILLGVLAWSIGKAILSFFKSTAEFDSFTISRVEGFEANDQLVTSVAGVDLLWITYPETGSNRKEYSLPRILDRQIDNTDLYAALYSETGAEVSIKSFRYCVHSYEIAIGYPSFAEFRENLERQVTARRGSGSALDDLSGIAFPPAKILAMHPLGSQAQPAVHTRSCMRKNEDGAQRTLLKQEVWEVLDRDGVKLVHMKQAQFAAATLVDAVTGACIAQPPEPGTPEVAAADQPVCWRELLTAAWQRSAETITTGQAELTELMGQRVWLSAQDILPHEGAAAMAGVEPDGIAPVEISGFDPNAAATVAGNLAQEIETARLRLRTWGAEESALLADAAGLGAIQVTISTMFGMDTAWRPWYWFDQEGLYLQRDVTNIVYGSAVAPTAVRPPRPFAGETTATVRLKRPARLSSDRRTSFVVQTGSKKAWEEGPQEKVDENLGSFVTRSINTSVENVERRVRRRALESAEALLRRRVTGWFEGAVQIEFEDREDPLLFEMRDWVSQQGFATTPGD